MVKTRKGQGQDGAVAQGQHGADEEAEGEDQEFVSIVTVRELLKVQESALKAIFESMISSFSSRLDDVVKTVSSLKTSLEFSQKEIGELKPLNLKLSEATRDIDQIKCDFGGMQLKTEYLENQSRRNNIRVSGIPEAEGETWDDSEAKVKAVIKEKLQIDVDIERAHRVERRKSSKRQNTNQPRTIVCRLRDWKQREAVVRKARKVKPEGLYVSEDLAPETLLKREAQIPKLKAAKESGKIAYFILDRLVIRDKPA